MPDLQKTNPPMPNDKQLRQENLRIVYEQVCRAHDGIADFRGKLLTLLPIASGGGIFLLLDPNTNYSPILPFIGLIGGLITFALYLYELRGIEKCNYLSACGKELEKGLLGEKKPRGAFTDDPEFAAYGFVRATGAALLVYPSIIGGWAYLGLTSCKQPPEDYHLPLAIFIGVAFVAFGADARHLQSENLKALLPSMKLDPQKFKDDSSAWK